MELEEFTRQFKAAIESVDELGVNGFDGGVQVHLRQGGFIECNSFVSTDIPTRIRTIGKHGWGYYPSTVKGVRLQHLFDCKKGDQNRVCRVQEVGSIPLWIVDKVD